MAVDNEEIPPERGVVDDVAPDRDDEMVLLKLSRRDALLLAEVCAAWSTGDFATELDLPRRNGQVFLPEDDNTWWSEVLPGSDEEDAFEQIRDVRRLIAWVESQIDIEAGHP